METLINFSLAALYTITLVYFIKLSLWLKRLEKEALEEQAKYEQLLKEMEDLILEYKERVNAQKQYHEFLRDGDKNNYEPPFTPTC